MSKPKAQPPHTPPLRLDAAGPILGRMLLTASYASSRPGIRPHITTGRDDGTVYTCTCPSATGHCWHRDNLALDFFRQRWAAATLPALAVRDAELRHYLAAGGPSAEDEAAARIEWTVVGDAINERMGRAA